MHPVNLHPSIFTNPGSFRYICTSIKRKAMKILHAIAAVATAAVLSAGCCPCRSYQKKARRPLVSTQWQLIQLGGSQIVPEAEKYTLTFYAEENRLAGIGACNRLTGSYTVGPKQALRIGPMAATRMACPGMERESEFIEALESATHYDMDGPMLLLLADGELRAVFQAVP